MFSRKNQTPTADAIERTERSIAEKKNIYEGAAGVQMRLTLELRELQKKRDNVKKELDKYDTQVKAKEAEIRKQTCLAERFCRITISLEKQLVNLRAREKFEKASSVSPAVSISSVTSDTSVHSVKKMGYVLAQREKTLGAQLPVERKLSSPARLMNSGSQISNKNIASQKVVGQPDSNQPVSLSHVVRDLSQEWDDFGETDLFLISKMEEDALLPCEQIEKDKEEKCSKDSSESSVVEEDSSDSEDTSESSSVDDSGKDEQTDQNENNKERRKSEEKTDENQIKEGTQNKEEKDTSPDDEGETNHKDDDGKEKEQEQGHENIKHRDESEHLGEVEKENEKIKEN